MKVKFWKKATELISICVLLGFSIMVLIIGMILSFASQWGCLIIGAVLCFFVFLVIIFYKQPFSKVLISDEGIEHKWFNKKITFIGWSDIIEINEISRSRDLSYLVFISKDNQLDVGLTKKMYETIMILCPYEHIKNKINNLNYFKYLHDWNMRY